MSRLPESLASSATGLVSATVNGDEITALIRALEEEGAAPRGTIAITSTITRLLHLGGQLAWTVDELLPDTDPNRVLKSALRYLMTSESVAVEARTRLRSHVAWLSQVRDIGYAIKC